MRNIAKKKANDARRHKERMATDLDYRLRKLLNTMRARCLSGKGRKDWQYYGAKHLEVSVTVADLKELWFRDRADWMAQPTIDRIDSNIGYTFANSRFCEYADNIRKAIATRRPRRWYRRPAEPTPQP